MILRSLGNPRSSDMRYGRGGLARVVSSAALTGLFSCVVAGCDTKTPEAKATTLETVFASPAPKSAGDDPRVEEPRSKGDAISASLAVIHEHLKDLETAYRDKAKIEGDLKKVAEQMQPLIEAARSHCDAMRRAAEDLRFQISLVPDGYTSAAATYRQRAAAYLDPDHRSINLKIADEFDRLAVATPKRLEAIEGFLVELHKAQVFLSDTDRCLKDAAAALAVFSAHGTVPEVPVDAKAFSYRLGQFINTALEYEEKLLQKPPKPPEPPPAEKAESPPHAAAASPTNTGVLSLEELHRQTARYTLKATEETERFTEDTTVSRPRAEVRPTDALRPGAVLSGAFRQGPYTIPCRLTVLRRDGERFSARLWAQNPDGPCESEAWGTVRDDVVTMASKRIYGNISPRSDYQGRLAANGISGRCNEGTNLASDFSLAAERGGVVALAGRGR